MYMYILNIRRATAHALGEITIIFMKKLYVLEKQLYIFSKQASNHNQGR